jgi:membrane protein
MARMRELPWVLKTIGPIEFVRRVVREIQDDGVMTIAAAVAFYWLFALFPFIIFLITLVPLLPVDVRQQAIHEISQTVEANLATGQTADIVMTQVRSIINTPKGGILSFGLLLTLWAASNGMSATMSALDRCYDVARPRNFFAHRGIAILMTVSVVFLTLCIILLIPVGNLLMRIFTNPEYVERIPDWAVGGSRWLLNTGRYALGGLLMMLLVSSLYQFGVAVRRRWTLISPGAVFTVVVIALFAFAFNLYLRHLGANSYAQTYGALGGVIILLMSFYLYAVVFLIGAEINAEIDYAVLGLRPGSPDASDSLPRLHRPDERERFRTAQQLEDQ